MRGARRAFTCLSVLILLAWAPQAYAAWGWLERLSGPGPFVGMDFLFPYSLPHRLTVATNNRNLDALRSLGVESVTLPEECREFLNDAAYHAFLGRELKITLPAAGPTEKCDNRLPGGLLDTFLNEMGLPAPPTVLGKEPPAFAEPEPEKEQAAYDKHKPEQGAVADIVRAGLVRANDRVLGILTQRLRQRTRRFGADPAGVFGGFKSMPIDNGRNIFHNQFFTLSLGLAFAYNNELRYADGFAGDRDVVWFSIYPAFEQRFKAGPNWFLQIGPAAHHFLGAQFDDFWVGSLRGRAGFQVWRVYIGAQADRFFSAITPDKFGAVPEQTDQDRWSWGFFFGLDLTGSGRSSRHPQRRRAQEN